MNKVPMIALSKLAKSVSLALLAVSFGVLSAQVPSSHEPWKSIPVPPLHDFHPPHPVHVTLPNGVQLFLMEDHELPFISGSVLIRGGEKDAPADKFGLVSLYGTTWRTSGTAPHPGDKLDDELAAKAASIETSGGQNSTSLNWRSFSSDFDSVFATAMDLLEHPAFNPQKLALAQQSAASVIMRRNDSAAGIARREAIELAYGKNNPYGRQQELATISAVTLDDLKAWHDRTVVGSDLFVGLVGDFDAKAMEAKLRAAFGAIPKGTPFARTEVSFQDPKAGFYFVDKSDVNQSNVYIVGLGTERRNPDFYALSVMNEIFSGGFGSRVFQTVRTRLGLAYAVGGSFGAAYDHPGLFATSLSTKSVSTVDATKETLAEINRLKSVPPTQEELRRAKDDLLNSFIFEFDTPEKVLNEQLTLAIYGYPSDYLEKFRAGVERVTAEDVTRVAQKYVQPDKLAVVIVGNNGEIQPALKGLGTISPLDITIPGAPTVQ